MTPCFHSTCFNTFKTDDTQKSCVLQLNRLVLPSLLNVLLLPGGIFFVHESFVLQHAAAICEWVFTVDILVFYGTFTYEFGTVTSETMMAGLQQSHHHGSGVIMGPRARGGAMKGLKSPGGSSTSTHLNCTPESIAML